MHDYGRVRYGCKENCRVILPSSQCDLNAVERDIKTHHPSLGGSDARPTCYQEFAGSAPPGPAGSATIFC